MNEIKRVISADYSGGSSDALSRIFYVSSTPFKERDYMVRKTGPDFLDFLPQEHRFFLARNFAVFFLIPKILHSFDGVSMENLWTNDGGT